MAATTDRHRTQNPQKLATQVPVLNRPLDSALKHRDFGSAQRSAAALLIFSSSFHITRRLPTDVSSRFELMMRHLYFLTTGHSHHLDRVPGSRADAGINGRHPDVHEQPAFAISVTDAGDGVCSA